MRNLPGGVCLPAALVFAFMAAPLYGNTQSKFPDRAPAVSRYDMTKEVTLQGTVQSIDSRVKAPMFFGAHMTISTAQGAAEVELGRFLLSGPDAVSFNVGEPVKITGVMTTIHNQQVLRARLIQTASRTIVVRNQNGFLVTPAARASQARLSVTGGAQ